MKTIIFAILVAFIASAAQAQVVSPAPTQFNTWTPGVTTDGTDATGATYTVQQGSYVITGSLVVTWFEITVSAWAGSPTGYVVVNGLPIANNAIDTGQCSLPNVPLSGGYESYSATIQPTATIANINTPSVVGKFPVSDVLNYLGSNPTWAITGVCWYHF